VNGILQIPSIPVPKNLKSINQYSLDGQLLHMWKSIMDAANNLGVSHDCLQHGIQHKERYKGYIWKRVN
jgi:hypothetical protein